jgi:hypothetical protein
MPGFLILDHVFVVIGTSSLHRIGCRRLHIFFIITPINKNDKGKESGRHFIFYAPYTFSGSWVMGVLWNSSY